MRFRPFFFLGFLFFFALVGSLGAAEGFLPPDKDVSLAHFPDKALHDVSNLFVPENIAPFAVGSVATALDWAVWDGQNTLASDLDGWNTEPLFDFGGFYGAGWVEGGMALGSWSFGALTQDERLQQFGRDLTESLVMATILVQGIKVSVNRTRPSGGGLSFPSGHTITAFCVAPVIQKYGGWEAGIPAYALAALAGISRVEDYDHYLSDVLAAATLGIVIGNAVVHVPDDVSVSAGPGRIDLSLAFN